MAWSPRRNTAAIATGIAGVLLGTVIGTAATLTVLPAPLVAAPTQRAVSNLGQYSVHNMGGTRPIADAAPYMGQYSVHNLGGTPAAGSAPSLGHYSVHNMGGTPVK